MKYILTFALVALTLLPTRAHAYNDFICKSFPVLTDTTAKIDIFGTGADTRDIRIIKVNDSTGASLQQAQDVTRPPSGGEAIVLFDFLTPNTAYKGLVRSADGIGFEDIGGCTFTTKASGGSTTTPPSTTTQPPSVPPANDAAFRLTITSQGAGQVTIYAQSLISVNATGWIEIKKSGQVTSTALICSSWSFPTGAQADPCVKTNLAPGAYTARVYATGTDNQNYGAQKEFAVTGGTSSTTTSGTPTAGTGTSGTPTAGTSGSGTFTPSGPSTTTGSGSYSGNTTLLSIRLENPLKIDNVQDAIKFFVNTMVKIAIPFIVVFFIWSGLQFILAQGNPDKLKKAKNTFMYTIIGTLLILGAWTITNAIIGTVNSIVK